MKVISVESIKYKYIIKIWEPYFHTSFKDIKISLYNEWFSFYPSQKPLLMIKQFHGQATVSHYHLNSVSYSFLLRTFIIRLLIIKKSFSSFITYPLTRVSVMLDGFLLFFYLEILSCYTYMYERSAAISNQFLKHKLHRIKHENLESIKIISN